MRRKIEVTAKKVEDAIDEGLRTLHTTIDEVDVKILSTGGFLRKAKIEMYYGEELPEEKPQAPEPVAVVPKKAEQIKKVQNEPKVAQDTFKKEKQENAPLPKTEKSNFKKPKENARTTVEPVEKSDIPHWGSAPIYAKEPNMATHFGKKPKAQPRPIVAEENSALGAEVNQAAPVQKGFIPRNQGANKNAKNDRPQKNLNDKNRRVKDHPYELPTTEQCDGAIHYLDELVAKMGIQGKAEYTIDDGLNLNIATEDSRLIGYRGEVLDALQYLVSLKVNELGGKYVRISLDTLNYRSKRKGILEGMAMRMADKAVKTGRKVVLESMNSADRRIVHAVLGENTSVTTRSEGQEPHRKIVIFPKRKNQEQA